MVPMIKLLFLLFLLLAACGSRQVQQIVTEETPYEATGDYIAVIIEPDILPDIPPHNTYIITLDVDPQTRTVQGITRIVFTNRSGMPMEQIVLRSFLNAFGEDVYPRPYPAQLIRRMEQAGDGRGYMSFEYALINNETLEYSVEGSVVTLKLEEAIEPYATVNLILQYSAYVPKLGHSIGGDEHAMWFGMFLPVLAVHDGTGWRVDAFYPVSRPFFLETANYRVEITVPVQYTVVGTGQRTEEILDEIRTTSFTGDMVRDFAFAVLSPYYSVASTETAGGVEINFHYHSETAQRRADEILEAARISVEYFEYKVGIYTFPQINIIETTLIYNSMPFSQMVFMDVNHYGGQIGLARSLGSQWFFGVVGVNRINEAWLDTGLSRFVQATMTHYTPELLHNHIEQERSAVARRGGLSLSDGLRVYTNRSYYVDAQGRIASIMLYELMQIMGEERFWEFIRLYYQTFSFQIADAEDFISLAEKVHGRSLRAFFDGWLTWVSPEPPEMENDNEEN